MKTYIDRTQRTNETVTQFYFELHKLAKAALPHETSKQIDKHFRERFVKGTSDQYVRQQLIALKSDPQLDSTQLLAKAIDLEAAASEADPSRHTAQTKQVT
jgi:hypothetical protein